MDYLKERVSYLKGLADGLKVDETTNEGKLLRNIIDVMDDFANAIDDLDDKQEDLEDLVESMDEDICAIEKDMYGDEDEDEDDECGCGCGCEHEDGEDDEELDGQYYEIECPECHDKLIVEEEAFIREEEIQCPNCHKDFDLKFECSCDEHGHCGCEEIAETEEPKEKKGKK